KEIISAADSSKWEAAMKILTDSASADQRYTRNDLTSIMTAAEFDNLLEAVGADAEKKKARTQGAAGGFHDASIPDPGGPILSPIRPEGKPPLKRQLSAPDFRVHLPPAPAATETRCFFRTWIRVVKKD